MSGYVYVCACALYHNICISEILIELLSFSVSKSECRIYTPQNVTLGLREMSPPSSFPIGQGPLGRSGSRQGLTYRQVSFLPAFLSEMVPSYFKGYI